jgi:hypothetical protein
MLKDALAGLNKNIGGTASGAISIRTARPALAMR